MVRTDLRDSYAKRVPEYERISQKPERQQDLATPGHRSVEGSSTPIACRDEEGNTDQEPLLSHGSRYEVIKNFPSAEELRMCVDGMGEEARLTELTSYGCLPYKINS